MVDSEAPDMVAGEHSPKEVSKFILVLIGILALSIWLAVVFEPALTWTTWMRWFMGVFFLVFASFKLIGYRMFVLMFAGYDVVAKRLKIYSYLFPFIELTLGIFYLADLVPDFRDWITFITMLVSSIGVFQEVRRRSGVHCACLGNIIKLPLSTTSLVEDLAMGAMALAMIII